MNLAVKTKNKNIQENGTLEHLVFDPLVFNKVKEMFGGRIRQLVTGSAPLSKKNFEFMEMIMSCPLYEIYGQTENTGAAFVRCLKDKMTGHVGGIVVKTLIKLVKLRI